MEPIITPPIYYESASHARSFGELEQFKLSHWANIDCKKDIEKAIAEHFDVPVRSGDASYSAFYEERYAAFEALVESRRME